MVNQMPEPLAENQHFIVRRVGEPEIASAARIAAAARKDPKLGGEMPQPFDELRSFYIERFTRAESKKNGLLLGLFSKDTDELVGTVAILPLEKDVKGYHEENYVKLLKKLLGTEKVSKSRLGFVTGLSVLGSYNKKGGAGLLSEAFEKFRLENFDYTILSTQNARVDKMLTSRGYQEIGSFPDDEDTLIVWHVHCAIEPSIKKSVVA